MTKQQVEKLWAKWWEKNKGVDIYSAFFEGASSFYRFLKDALRKGGQDDASDDRVR